MKKYMKGYWDKPDGMGWKIMAKEEEDWSIPNGKSWLSLVPKRPISKFKRTK